MSTYPSSPGAVGHFSAGKQFNIDQNWDYTPEGLKKLQIKNDIERSLENNNLHADLKVFGVEVSSGNIEVKFGVKTDNVNDNFKIVQLEGVTINQDWADQNEESFPYEVKVAASHLSFIYKTLEEVRSQINKTEEEI